MMHRSLFNAMVAVASAIAATGAMAEDRFAVSDEQLTRLGVTLGSAEPVELIELAAAPASVVVPPARQALVSAPLGGVVARLLVADGDAIKAGDVVAELDSVDYVELQRDYLRAVAAAELNVAQEARDRELFDEGIIAERRLLETAAAARVARVELEQVRAHLELAGLSRGALERLEANRELSRRLVLRAPLSGIVTAVHAEVGERLGSLDPIAAVADLAELWLELRLPQERAVRVGVGALVAVTVGTETLFGTVTTVGGTVDAGTQTVLVRAAVSNERGALRAGQFLRARVLARPEAGVVFAVPSAAVTRDGEFAMLFVRSGAEVVARRVDVLGDDGSLVYIGGIGADALVAVDGISALKALWLASTEGEGG